MWGEKFKQKYWEFLNYLCLEPKRLIKVIVLCACSVVVVFQLTECFQKLINPPINTHSRFELNDSMLYPAITFCRNPPYKSAVMERYNLSHHPKYANSFKNFNFNESTLDEVFQEATYNQSEFFIQYGLDSLRENVEVISSMHLDMGQCFTLNPLTTTNHSWKEVGYSIMLQHDVKHSEAPLFGEDLPGWHVFIHAQAEGFAENRMQSSGRVEYLFMEVDEEVEVKLTTQHFHMLPSSDNLCTTESEMSSTRCSELCHWSHVVEQVGCTGPWMPDIEGEQCHTAHDTQQLIKYYKLMEDMDSTVCGCYQPCSGSIFTSFVMNRKHFNISIPAAQLWMYYTSKMVTIVEEFHGYDLTQFVADLGGSLGFLLGLSVLGLIGLLEKIFELLFIRRWIAERKIKRKLNEGFENSTEKRQDELSQHESSDATLAVANIKK
ncbi:uncharacterized protein LOC131430409 [Malaya genurostris]|uniref:uncharacterized protein LOC131430409 n=1 Tax=Malaya genurostris TaxID=325434 RepID=UPI0026F3AAFA|nr:uncharacterized protein LOC131430409 [Malaya genurostris]